MKHAHKFLTALIVTLCMLVASGMFGGCTVTPENTTPEQAATLEQLQQAEADALAAGDGEALAKAQRDLQAFEERVLRERAGPIVAGLSAVHPLVAAFSPLALALVPLLGKRGRAMAKKTVNALNPLTPVEDGGTRGIALGEAAQAVWAYFGGGHSTPDGAAALAKCTEKPADATAGGTGA